MTEPTVTVQLHTGPLPPTLPLHLENCGAWFCFEGVVRPLENEQELEALEYEAYEPMTTNQLRALASEIVEAHGLHALHVDHSTGRVPVGAVSFRLQIASPHRKEALAAMDAFIDRMKADVALWKRPIFARVGAS